ncbi:hypothetical protein SESBI_48180 [Sesbania bispinosa]|nr:hypothetical protein SESBI_48180 [Sesbania bispinosa]
MEDSNSDVAGEKADVDLTLKDSSGAHESSVTNGESKDTFGNSAQSENNNNNFIQEGISKNNSSSNSNCHKDASQKVQPSSFKTPPELKKDESLQKAYIINSNSQQPKRKRWKLDSQRIELNCWKPSFHP